MKTWAAIVAIGTFAINCWLVWPLPAERLAALAALQMIQPILVHVMRHT